VANVATPESSIKTSNRESTYSLRDVFGEQPGFQTLLRHRCPICKEVSGYEHSSYCFDHGSGERCHRTYSGELRLQLFQLAARTDRRIGEARFMFDGHEYFLEPGERFVTTIEFAAVQAK